MDEKSKPKVGQKVEDYVYGAGINYTGTIVKVSKKYATVSLKTTLSWFQKLILGKTPDMSSVEIPIAKFSSMDFVDDTWQLDTFL
jgi:hypothetical protein